MDIYIIETNDSEYIDTKLLFRYRKRDISNEKKLKIHCLAYLMLDRILKNIYKIENRNIVFENGKPFLENKNKHFSISHSGEYIAICISDNICGIDIEQNKKRNFIAIGKRMKFQAATLDDFYLDWTKYESEYKLGKSSNSIKQFKYNNYTITASSAYKDEDFEIFIQNTNEFPNLNT